MLVVHVAAPFVVQSTVTGRMLLLSSSPHERGLSIATIDVVHTVLHQVLEMAVDDCCIRRNPSENVLKELKQAVAMKNEKRRTLTKQEQDLFLDYLHRTPQYQHWYPVFAIMIGTGLHVGEAVGLSSLLNHNETSSL